MFRKRYIQNTVNIIVMFICICIIFAGTTITKNLQETKANIKSNIEKEWRQQAKRTLLNIQEQFMYDIDNKIVDPANELSLQQWAKRNISGVLNGGPTGDTFMINLGNEKFIWDGSPDCAKPEFIENGRFMKDEPKLHQDQERAEFILSKMRLAQSTINTNEEYWWNFDGSPEYLEWIVIPPGTLGFNTEPITINGVKNANYSKILIALGTQEDEIESTFEKDFQAIDENIYYIKIFMCLCIFVCFSNLIIYVFLSKKAERRY